MNRKQEMITKAMDGIIAQGQKSISGLKCVYRGEDNCKCAIGQLIDDSVYKPYLEQKTAGHELVKRAVAASGWPEILNGGEEHKYYDLMTHLQCVHDARLVSEWPMLKEELLREYA